MRRVKQEIGDKAEILEIIRSAEICHLALCDGDIPYVVPLNFGFRDNTVYIHCAKEGRKIDIIRKNNNVCVEWVGESLVLTAGVACDFSAKYRSVIGTGKAFVVEGFSEKREALEILMSQYSGSTYTFEVKDVERVGILKVVLQELTGKSSA